MSGTQVCLWNWSLTPDGSAGRFPSCLRICYAPPAAHLPVRQRHFERDDKPLTGLTAVKAQALLIYLAVTGRPHTRSALAGLLWSDAGETAAHNSLARDACPSASGRRRLHCGHTPDHRPRTRIGSVARRNALFAGLQSLTDSRAPASRKANTRPCVRLYTSTVATFSPASTCPMPNYLMNG